MIATTVNLSDGPLRELSRQVDAASKAYVKVGVLASSVRRASGGVGNSRFTGTWRRWSKKAGAYVTSTGAWSKTLGKFLTNAEIGAIHEFGSPKAKIPERSFLRMPILSRLGDELKTVPIQDWTNLLLTGGLVGVLRAIGQAAVNVIQAAFHSGGFGRWAKLKPATIRRKKSSDILVDTTQLRRSITFAVVAPAATARGIKP